ncbi:carbonic anhydrase family protein [Tautonia rosea]|nr:carbonic anhydrase family protein [Tautonia rosea]
MHHEHLPLQSPIDLGEARPMTHQLSSAEIAIHWESAVNGEICEGDHGPIIVFEESTATINVLVPGTRAATRFTLAQLHFHYESEHRLNGRQWPFELHIVHTATEPDPTRPGKNRTIYAVVGVMVEGGGQRGAKSDQTLSELVGKLRTYSTAETDEKSRAAKLTAPLNPNDLVPFDPTSPVTHVPLWRYEGSLTSKIGEPNEGYVSWIVIEPTLQVSDETLEQWKLLKHKANEPQPLERRFVLYSPGSGRGTGQIG